MKYQSIRKIIIINASILLLFVAWFVTDVHITQGKKTVITTSNMFNSGYLIARNAAWGTLLRRIKQMPQGTQSSPRQSFLEVYNQVIPVDQWWDTLYPQKSEAIKQLATIYQLQGDWKKLQEVSSEHILIDPRQAEYYYLSALAYEKEGQMWEAEKRYFETLSIDATHRKTYIRLSGILEKKGDYYRIQEILDTYDQAYYLGKKKVCVFWGISSFEQAHGTCTALAGVAGKHVYSFEIPAEDQLQRIRLDVPKSTVTLLSMTVRSANGAIIEKRIGGNNWEGTKGIVQKSKNTFSALGEDNRLQTRLRLDAAKAKRTITITLRIDPDAKLQQYREVVNERIS